MRRILIMLLLLIFPFQVTLAAADACCRYDKIVRHGECNEQAQTSKLADTSHGLSKIDVHCVLCVLGAAGYLPTQTSTPLRHSVDRSAAPPASVVRFASYLEPRPERPQWLPSA